MNHPVSFLAWSADAKRLMVTTDLGIQVWDVTAKELLRTVDPQGPKDKRARCAAAPSLDGKRFATLCRNEQGKILRFDLQTCHDRDAVGGGSLGVAIHGLVAR